MTFATTADAVPEDDAETPANDGFEEEASNGTAGADRLFDALAIADGGGDSSFSSSI